MGMSTYVQSINKTEYTSYNQTYMSRECQQIYKYLVIVMFKRLCCFQLHYAVQKPY